LSIVSGVFDTSPSYINAISIHTPFVQLINSQDAQSYGLRIGKTTSYTDFNPGISFGTGSKVMLQVSPGKGFDNGKSLQWLASSEANTAKQILASVHSL
jgi:hypothetical protein